MRTFMLAAALSISVWANGQSTISLTCAPSCGTTTFAANGFAANGSGAGQVSLTSGTVASIPTAGYPANAITLFAPSSVTAAYGIAPAGTAAAGFWYGTLGTPPSSLSVTLNGMGQITAPTGALSGSSGYLTPPPCYYSGGTAPSAVATCSFTILTGGQLSLSIGSSGSGYSSGSPPSIGIGPTLGLSYLGASNTTNLPTSGYNVQITTGSIPSTHLGMFDLSGDLVDSTIVSTNVPLLNATNNFSANNTFSGIVLGGNTITGSQGNTAKAQLTAGGSTTSGDLVTYDGSGNVQDSGIQSLSISTSGTGALWMPQINLPANAVSQIEVTGTQVNVIQVVVPYKIAVNKVTIHIATASSGAHATVGLYNAAGSTKLIDIGPQSCTSTGPITVTLGSTVTLEPNVYWWAWGNTDNACGVLGVTISTALLSMFNNNTTHFAKSSNPLSSGNLPSMLGTLTPISNVGMAYGLLEP